MATVFVAHSKQLALWGNDVGLGKNLYLVGVAEDDAALQGDLAVHPCGADDWLLLQQQEAPGVEASALWARLAGKEKRIDPQLYPRLRGQAGLFKVKPEHVENHLLIKTALAGMDTAGIKVKPADIAAYLLHNALK
jgi:hypothetical protein